MTGIESLEFLKESNAIEGVYDADSLVQAMYAWDYLTDQSMLTLPVILRTHKILMLHQNLRPDEKGYFRTVPVWVGGREGVKHDKIKEYLAALCSDIDAKRTDWKEAHVQYEIIHPFVDGNGRTGRMFMNWHRLRDDLPLLVIHEGDEQQEYYKWFPNEKRHNMG